MLSKICRTWSFLSVAVQRTEKKLCKDLVRTWTAIVLLIKPVVWWHSRCLSHHGLLKLSHLTVVQITLFTVFSLVSWRLHVFTWHICLYNFIHFTFCISLKKRINGWCNKIRSHPTETSEQGSKHKFWSTNKYSRLVRTKTIRSQIKKDLKNCETNFMNLNMLLLKLHFTRASATNQY